MALCKTTVLKVYNHVIEDVISGVRDIFTDEGLDEQVLQELKTLWESKLHASKAVDANADAPDVKPGKKTEVVTNNQTFTQPIKREVYNQTAKRDFVQHPVLKGGSENSLHLNNHQVQNHIVTEDKMIPIQITLPTQPTIDAITRVLTIHVPASALNGPQLHTLLTGPVITATMGLPTPLASSLLQQHVNAALQSQQQQMAKMALPQTDGADDNMEMQPSTSSTTHSTANRKAQRGTKMTSRRKAITVEFVRNPVDGGTDTSDEDDDGSDEDGSEDEIDEEKEDEDPELEDGAPEEQPLNSEDDVTDEEPTDLFDTDNVVVCQYDKITRSRNKWKFYLKDGIMNLEGEDFIFQKANGDAEW